MAIKFERVKAGDVLWDCRRTKMGNTTMSRMSAWPVRVISIDHEKRTAVVSWNTNPPETRLASQIERLRRSQPKNAA